MQKPGEGSHISVKAYWETCGIAAGMDSAIFYEEPPLALILAFV